MGLPLSNRDKYNIEKTKRILSSHSSGGTYDMVALWSKGKRFHVGENELARPATTLDPDYPDICGIHAELSLCLTNSGAEDFMRGGTVYIIGRKSNSGNYMRNTKPCKYCSAVLHMTRVRYVVYVENGVFIKKKW